MENKSGLHPAGVVVLVEPYEPEIAKSSLVIPTNVRLATRQVETRARVIEVGAEAWKEESSPRARPGDVMLIAKYAGVMAVGPLDGKQYRLVNDRDLFCRIDTTDEVKSNG